MAEWFGWVRQGWGVVKRGCCVGLRWGRCVRSVILVNEIMWRNVLDGVVGASTLGIKLNASYS